MFVQLEEKTNNPSDIYGCRRRAILLLFFVRQKCTSLLSVQIYVYIKYYIAAAPPRPLNLAIAAGDDRFYAFGSFNMARQYYSDKLDVFVLIKSHFSLGSRFIYTIYIYKHRYALYPANRTLQCIHRLLQKTAKGCGGGRKEKRE